jgi:hypothetical protein
MWQMWQTWVILLIGFVFVGMGVSVRCGWYKTWYIKRVYPPFTYRAAQYFIFPISLFWFTFPVVGLLPIPKETKSILGLVGVCGSPALCLILAIWQPRWLKPTWQRRLEDRYSREEINTVFRPAWRKMNHREWSRLIETEEGLEQLVQMARSQQRCT